MNLEISSLLLASLSLPQQNPKYIHNTCLPKFGLANNFQCLWPLFTANNLAVVSWSHLCFCFDCTNLRTNTALPICGFHGLIKAIHAIGINRREWREQVWFSSRDQSSASSGNRIAIYKSSRGPPANPKIKCWKAARRWCSAIRHRNGRSWKSLLIQGLIRRYTQRMTSHKLLPKHVRKNVRKPNVTLWKHLRKPGVSTKRRLRSQVKQIWRTCNGTNSKYNNWNNNSEIEILCLLKMHSPSH